MEEKMIQRQPTEWKAFFQMRVVGTSAGKFENVVVKQ